MAYSFSPELEDTTTDLVWVGDETHFYSSDHVYANSEDVQGTDVAIDTTPVHPIRSYDPMYCDADPAQDEHLVNLGYMEATLEDLVRLVPVSDITNPTELGSETSNEEGCLLLAFETSGSLRSTLYRYDTTGAANSPYVVAGSAGFWHAVGGRYTDLDTYIQGALQVNNNITTLAQLGGETLSVTDTAAIGGTLNANGDVNLGNAVTDSISFVGRADTDLVPIADNSHDLGASGLEWKDLYVDGTAYIDTGDFHVALSCDGAISGDTLSSVGNTSVGGALSVTGNLTVSGNVDLGGDSSDDILFSGRVHSNIIPDTGNAYDLGSGALGWATIYCNTLDASSISAPSGSWHDAVTLAGSYNYLTLTGQEIALHQIDLTTDVSGVLPEGNIAASIARDSEVTSAISTHASDDDAHHDPVTVTGETYASIAGQQITFDVINLASQVFGTLPLTNLETIDDSDVTAAAGATNYSPTASNVEGHLAGIDTALGSATTSPGGSDSQIQYNDGGSFGGSAQMTFDDSSGIITLGTLQMDITGILTHSGDFTHTGDFLVEDDSSNDCIDVDGTTGKVMLGKSHSDHDWGISGSQVAHYKCNDNAADTTVTNESGSNASLAGGKNTEDADYPSFSDELNNSLLLDGTSDYIDCGQTFQTTFQSAFSIALWMRPHDTSALSEVFGVKANSGADVVELFFFGGGGAYRARYYSNGNNAEFAAAYGPAATQGTWHHLVMTVDSSNLLLYINGVKAAANPSYDGNMSGVTMGDFDANSRNFYFGAKNNAGSMVNPLDGQLDDIRIFSKALSADEIAAIYNSGNGTEDDSGSYEVDVTGDAFVSGQLHCANLLQLSDPSAKEFDAEVPDTTKEWDKLPESVSYYKQTELKTEEKFLGFDASKMPQAMVHRVGENDYVSLMGVLAALVQKVDKLEAALAAK